MSAGVALRSASGNADCVTIDAQGLGRVFFAENIDSLSSITGFTITGVDDADLYGGGIYCRYSELEVRDCVIRDNHTGRSAGLNIDESEFSMINCVISNNVADYGGGGMRIHRCAPLIQDCIFDSNWGMDGGAVFVRTEGTPRFENCLFTNNVAQFWGGAICDDGFDSGTVIDHCTFYANEAGWTGGGVWVANDTLLIKNSIVAFSGEGGGIYNASVEGTRDAVIYTECNDVFGNVGGNYGGEMTDQTGFDGNISTHPLFCDQDAGDFSLAAGSACLPGNNDCGVLMGAFGLGCNWPTDSPDTPAALNRLSIFPNPFNPSTKIRFSLESESVVTLRIYDLSGRVVSELALGVTYGAGDHGVDWNGFSDQGAPVSSGVYILKAELGQWQSSEKLILLK